MSAAAGRELPASGSGPQRERGPSGECDDMGGRPPIQDGQLPLVLVAEDEEPIAAALILIIEDAGYTPLVAAHGRDALELTRAHRPALVITDLMMPYIDGANLIATIRDDARRDHCAPPPLVLMTAAGMRRAEEVGADAVLRKPFNIEDVEALLHRFLGTARRQTDSGEPLP